MDARTSSIATRSTSRPLLAGLVASFLLGGALVGYGVYRFVGHEPAGPDAGQGAASATSSPDPMLMAIAPEPSPSATAREAAKAVEQVREQQGGIDQRLAAAEQRLARLDLQAQAISGNTARAEGLLIAFAARRSIEKGAQLGYLADQLRLRFGDAKPNAVRTIIDFSRRPVTLDQLIARLQGLGPVLAQPNDMPAWDRMKLELSDLFVVRRESAPSPQPRRRLERARLFLESGRTENAIAEVSNLPGAAEAKSWIADARRYAEAQEALDLIETTAVLEPRMLRDGSGSRIEQPSPAEAGN